jgi:hypothetical protein
MTAFTHFDNLLDEKFGSEAPRTADFKRPLRSASDYHQDIESEKRTGPRFRNRMTWQTNWMQKVMRMMWKQHPKTPM